MLGYPLRPQAWGSCNFGRPILVLGGALDGGPGEGLSEKPPQPHSVQGLPRPPRASQGLPKPPGPPDPPGPPKSAAFPHQKSERSGLKRLGNGLEAALSTSSTWWTHCCSLPRYHEFPLLFCTCVRLSHARRSAVPINTAGATPSTRQRHIAASLSLPTEAHASNRARGVLEIHGGLVEKPLPAHKHTHQATQKGTASSSSSMVRGQNSWASLCSYGLHPLHCSPPRHR